ncbi:olfactory receptor 10A7-like [Pelodytes ibericus]
MCEDNQTTVTEFLLLGFNNLLHFKVLLFLTFLLVYIVILVGNLLLIIVSTHRSFKVPMFFFLKNLALADILFTTNIMPNMLHIILREGNTISTMGCFAQYYFHCISVCAQSLILTVMSFDRYVAICYPLRYSTIMNPELCFQLVFWSWASGFIVMPAEMISLTQLTFCGSHLIDHFFCDFAPVLQIASSDTFTVVWEDYILSILLICFPFMFVIVSYTFIFITILKITSASGRQKAFSTCSSHLVTLCTYYGTMITIYTFPVGEDTPIGNKLKSLLYTVLTPLINPIIYSMRNQEIRKYLQQRLCRHGRGNIC